MRTIGQDTLRYTSDDTIRIDLAGVMPDEAAWEHSHIIKVADGFAIAIGDGGTIHVLTSASLSALEADLLLL